MHHCIAELFLHQLSTAQSRQVRRRLLWNEAGSKESDPPTSVTVAGCAISISDRLRIHGVTLDATLSFDEHITTVVKTCNYHLRALRHIRRCITQDIAGTIACSIAGSVGSRIDYCNRLLFGASVKAFYGSQRVQNNLARAVFDIGIRKLHDSGRRSFDLLRELHWLPVQASVTYKVALLCFKCYKLGMPTYLSWLLEQYRQTRSLRSSSLNILSVPRSRIKTASHRLSIVAPSVWNILPATVRPDSSVGLFRSQLKTHLYHLSFDGQ